MSRRAAQTRIRIILSKPPYVPNAPLDGCRTCLVGDFVTHWHTPAELWLACLEPFPVWHLVVWEGEHNRWVCLCQSHQNDRYYPKAKPRNAWSASGCVHIERAVRYIELRKLGLPERLVAIKAEGL